MILTTCLLLKTTPPSGFIPVRVERWSLQQEKVLFKDLNHITSGDSHRSVTNYQRNLLSRYDTPELQDSPEPDFRTTIYWKPDVHFSQEGEAVVEFYTADTPGTYRIIGEGVTGSGKLISFKEEIKIDRSVK